MYILISVFSSWWLSHRLGFRYAVLSGREREGVVHVRSEAEASLGLSNSGSTFRRNQRPREGE